MTTVPYQSLVHLSDWNDSNRKDNLVFFYCTVTHKVVAHTFVTSTSVLNLPELETMKPAENCRAAVSLFASVISDIPEKEKNMSMAIQQSKDKQYFHELCACFHWRSFGLVNSRGSQCKFYFYAWHCVGSGILCNSTTLYETRFPDNMSHSFSWFPVRKHSYVS